MRYLHTMVRVTDLDRSLYFYCELLGLKEIRRLDNEKGHTRWCFSRRPRMRNARLRNTHQWFELTHNWEPKDYDGGRNFGHLAYYVDDIYANV